MHAPTFARERRHSYEIVLLDVFDRFDSQITNQLRLFAGLNVQPLNVFERLVPIVAIAQVARGFLHLGFTPGELLISDGNQFFRSVWDHLRGQLDHQCFTANRITNNIARITGPRVAASSPLETGLLVQRSICTTAGRPRSSIRNFSRSHTGLVTHEGGIVLQRLVRRLIRLGHPPGEDRIVAIVIVEPVSKRVSQAADICGRAISNILLHAERARSYLSGRLGLCVVEFSIWATRACSHRPAQLLNLFAYVCQ